MADKGRYIRALGLTTACPGVTEVGLGGFLDWSLSKAPAALGGLIADKVYDMANRKWPNAKRGAVFTGGVCVVLAAYGLQALITRFKAGWTLVADRMTDGMVGRTSPELWHLFWGMWDKDKAGQAALKSGRAAAVAAGVLPAEASVSLDGDRQSVKEVAAMLRDSPETTQDLADEMFAIMKKGGVDINAEGQRAVVKSMRQASAKFARGDF